MHPPLLLPFPIPDSILLLIHLHLLQCPLELDPNMFNSNIHGIGDRIKTMEQIIYFLLGKAEGQQRLKVLLPMYPSKRPADTVAFRNAVVKYLEGLRTAALKSPQPAKQQASNAKAAVRSSRTPNSIGPSHTKGGMVKKPPLPPKRPVPSARSVSSLSSITPKQASTSRSASVGISKPSTLHSASKVLTGTDETKSSASSNPAVQSNITVHGWWWKDVPVRKSLFEECAGPRFERLILALSIHVLTLRDVRVTSSDPSRNDALVGLNSASNLDMFAMLSEQADDYRELVQRLGALQVHLSEGEQNLVRQRQTLHSLKALIPSDLPAKSDNQPSLQELGTQITEVISTLHISWRPSLNPKGLAGGLGDEESDSSEQDSMVRWLFALAGASRHLEDPSSSVQDVGEIHPVDRRKVRKSVAASRKTILPAPPLPTVAAHHASHLEAISVAKDRVANLRAIQDSSLEGNAHFEEAHDLKNGEQIQPQDTNSIVYSSLIGEEADLSGSLKRFMQEMAELDDRVEKELEIKQRLLLEAYGEDKRAIGHDERGMNHPERSWHSALQQPFEGVGLDFESNTSLPFVLSQWNRTPHHSEVAMSIQRAIESALNDIMADLTADHEREWEGLDEVPLEDSEGALESEDEETANRTVVQPTTKSPIKHTRIPMILQTPKLNVPLVQSMSTTEHPGIQSRHNNVTPKYAQQSSTPPPPTAVRISQTPSKRTRQKAQTTPSRVMVTPSFFFSPGDGMEDLKEILPPFQSPWRSVARSKKSPRKSGRVSIHRPRLSKGRLGSSSSFNRTPLKSGKRLSNIVPPISFPFAKLGQATPRASLDDVYEELVDELVKSSNKRTPPAPSLSMSARRLLDPKNNIQRSSPFKNLAGSGRAPLSPQSPDIGTEIVAIEENEFEGQEVELSFGTARPLFSNNAVMDDWEDIDGTSSLRHTKATKASTTPRFSEGPSFTLRDMLLKVGQEGMMGVNGTFNFDLLDKSQVDLGDDSMFDGI